MNEKYIEQIALFMNDGNGSRIWVSDGAGGKTSYNNSWDWLMPVWSKCIMVIGVYMHTHEDNSITKLWLEKSHEISNFISAVEIRSSFYKISHLINWYQEMMNDRTSAHYGN